MELPQSKC